jgi:hypothetical protein
VSRGRHPRLPENPTTGYRLQFDAAVGLTLSGESFSPGSSALGVARARALRLVGSGDRVPQVLDHHRQGGP